jgi:hypothetical protein
MLNMRDLKLLLIQSNQSRNIFIEHPGVNQRFGLFFIQLSSKYWNSFVFLDFILPSSNFNRNNESVKSFIMV